MERRQGGCCGTGRGSNSDFGGVFVSIFSTFVSEGVWIIQVSSVQKQEAVLISI
jgi:hypothetical protein